MVPTLVKPEVLAGGIAVVVDQLRASTTICTALANGAREVRPCLEPFHALSARSGFHDPSVVLGGERMGRRIEGFDLGNSPSEYTRSVVSGKTIVFTTTNGTRVLYHAARAERVLVGCLANVDALCEVLERDTRDVHIVCAGVQGEFAAEDVLAAGAIASRLVAHAPASEAASWRPDDGAQIAILAWRHASVSGDDLLAAMRASRGGRNLTSIRLGADVHRATFGAQVRVVPEFDRHTTTLRAARLPSEAAAEPVTLSEITPEAGPAPEGADAAGQ